MNRYITYEKDFSVIGCMSETEFKQHKDLGGDDRDWHEYVWQFAPDKLTAIAQHSAKHDAWQRNPNKETY